MLENGMKVRTTKSAGSTDWSDPSRADAKWGVDGTIVQHSNSHGLIYKVLHDCGSTAWYEPAELTVFSEPCKVNTSTASLTCKLSDLAPKSVEDKD